jgi:hypothetical protein
MEVVDENGEHVIDIVNNCSCSVDLEANDIQ